jgi:hypothetical protein
MRELGRDRPDAVKVADPEALRIMKVTFIF